MPFQSFARCPSCGSDMVLRKVRPGMFGCPRCQAEFHHNYRRWAAGVPLVILLAVALFYLLPGLGVWIVIGAVGISSLIIGSGRDFIIDLPGQSVEPCFISPQEKESTFFKIAMVCFFFIAMVALGWSLTGLIQFLRR